MAHKKASIAKLQRVQNTLARVVLNKPKYKHSTDLYAFTSLAANGTKNREQTSAYFNNFPFERAINSTVSLRSSSRPLLYVPGTRIPCVVENLTYSSSDNLVQASCNCTPVKQYRLF